MKKLTQSKKKKALRQERDYLYIATRGGEASRAGEKKISLAVKGIKLLKRLNRLIDRELIISNDERYYNEKTLSRIEAAENDLISKINKTLKPLKIAVAFNTYAYLYDTTKGRGYQLGLNFVF